MRTGSWIVLTALLATLGCSEKSGAKSNDGSADRENDRDGSEPGPQHSDAGEDGATPRTDASTVLDSGVACAVPPVFTTVLPGAGQVDLLFVVDNSRSMREEQQNLAAQLPRLIRTLASGRLEDATGRVIRRFPPVRSLHLGVVSSDIGVNGLPPATQNVVDCQGSGDDGLLLTTPDPSDPTCPLQPAVGSYLEFQAMRDDVAELSRNFACIARLGTDGCGFEQQLEAMWKALAPSTDTSFSLGTGGHGDLANAGFLRTDSLLAVIHVSDEEDCSIPDGSRDLFAPGTGDEPLDVNVRCIRSLERLHPVDRYVDGLRSLRKGVPNQLIFAAIVGIPPEAETQMAGISQDFDGILAREDMQYRELATAPGESIYPETSCTSEHGKAYAPRRFVEVAKSFGRNGLVRSICQADFSGALLGIIDKIADQLTRETGRCTLDAQCPTDFRCAQPGSKNEGLCLNPECVEVH